MSRWAIMLPLFAVLAAATALPTYGVSASELLPVRGGSREQLFGPEELLIDDYSHVLVAKIEALTTPGPFTNGHAPSVSLQVLKSMKGAFEERTLTAAWAPFPHDVDWVGPGAREAIRAWSERPMDAPDVGSTWLIAGTFEDGHFRVSPVCRYPHSEKVERQVRFVLAEGPAWLKKAKEEGGSQHFKEIREADLKVEHSADLDRLVAVSTDIIVGKPQGAEMGLGSYTILFYDSERLLDSRQESERTDRPCIGVDARFAARRMALLRWAGACAPAGAIIAFIRTSDHDIEIPDAARPSRDPRPLVFADAANGMICATPERIERVKALIAARSKPPHP